MITKEELLVALEDSSRNLYKSNEVFGLALKGLESESTVKRLIQDRNLWRKKHDDLADELDDKIIALEEKLKDKDASLDEASKIINDAREKHRDLEIQIEHVKNGRLQAEDQIAVLENKLRDTVTLKYHDETVATATRRISILIIERDAFQRLAGDLQTEKSCMRANLENMCKELDVLKGEIVKHEEAYCARNALIDELFTENEELKIKIEKFKAFFTGKD